MGFNNTAELVTFMGDSANAIANPITFTNANPITLTSGSITLTGTKPLSVILDDPMHEVLEARILELEGQLADARALILDLSSNFRR